MNSPFVSDQLLALIDRLGRLFVWKRRSLGGEVRSGVLAVGQHAAETLAERDAAQASLRLARDVEGQLRSEVAILSGRLNNAAAAYVRVKNELREIAESHASTSTMFQLVAKLHDARPEPHAAVTEFNRLLTEDYLRFANAESSLAEEAKSLMLLQSVSQELEMIARFPDIHRHRKISIVGGFSAGKSGFINSFINDPDIRLAEGVLPVTAIPSYVVASDVSSIRACSINGGQFELDPALYNKLSHTFVQSLGFNLSDLMPFVFVGTQLDAEYFEHVCLIDTPGYNAGHGVVEGGARDRQQALNLAHQADGLIWMIGVDANGAVTSSDLDFLKDVGHKSPLYVVLNKCDTRPDADLVDIMERIKDDLATRDINMAGISAYSALEQREIHYRDESLYDFLRKNNVPGDAGTALVMRVNEVFDMYDRALKEDKTRAKQQRAMVMNLELDCYEAGGAAMRDKVESTLTKLKQSLSPFPDTILVEQSRDLRAKFIHCIESVTKPLSSQHSRT